MSCEAVRINGAATTGEQQRRQLGSNCYHTMPGLSSTDTVEFFRIVRLVYVKPTTPLISDIDVELRSIVYPVSYEMFVPELSQSQESASILPASPAGLCVDKMKDTFDKVVAFLHHSGRPCEQT